MPLMIVEKGCALHHPRIEAVAGVACHLAHDVQSVLEPLQLAASRRREDRDFAIFTLVSVLRSYGVFALSETSASVV
jgi:hypothetical protein